MIKKMPAKKGDKVEKSGGKAKDAKDAKDAKVAKDTKVSKDAKDIKDIKVKSKKVEVVSYENSKLAELIEAITNMDKEFKAIKTLVKLVIKENDKKEKILKKERDRKEKARLSPSGFAKPTEISTEMCDFLEIAHGTLMSRTEVTKNINTYVSKNNLKDPVNGRIIRPDAALKKLLRVKDGDEVTFFHMQRLLNPHIKPFKQATPATV
jgi:chromatin remodeling complex protein RSC6